MGNSEDSKRTDLSDIHAVQLEMMKTLAAVFEKNGLRYALYCGTLLGAIRHRGFIPWDDDVDLVMPLEDYRRFLRLAVRTEKENERLINALEEILYTKFHLRFAPAR